MEFGPHTGFILAAYAAAALVVALLLVWITADHRLQRRLLAGLEERGSRRRSSAGDRGQSA